MNQTIQFPFEGYGAIYAVVRGLTIDNAELGDEFANHHFKPHYATDDTGTVEAD